MVALLVLVWLVLVFASRFPVSAVTLIFSLPVSWYLSDYFAIGEGHSIVLASVAIFSSGVICRYVLRSRERARGFHVRVSDRRERKAMESRNVLLLPAFRTDVDNVVREIMAASRPVVESGARPVVIGSPALNSDVNARRFSRGPTGVLLWR